MNTDNIQLSTQKPMIFTVLAVLPETCIEVRVSYTAWLHWVEACEWMANHPSYMSLKVEGFTDYQI